MLWCAPLLWFFKCPHFGTNKGISYHIILYHIIISYYIISSYHHIILYHIISYHHIILYHIILYHIIISYHIISYYIISYHIKLYHILSYYIISSYHIISYHILYHIIYYIISSYHIILYHIIISYYIILYHIISYHHIILYHIISYHIISYHIIISYIISYIIYHIISYHIILYHIIPSYHISYHIISYQIWYIISYQYLLAQQKDRLEYIHALGCPFVFTWLQPVVENMQTTEAERDCLPYAKCTHTHTHTQTHTHVLKHTHLHYHHSLGRRLRERGSVMMDALSLLPPDRRSEGHWCVCVCVRVCVCVCVCCVCACVCVCVCVWLLSRLFLWPRLPLFEAFSLSICPGTALFSVPGPAALTGGVATVMDDCALSFSVRVLHLCYLPCGSLSKTSSQVSYTPSPPPPPPPSFYPALHPPALPSLLYLAHYWDPFQMLEQSVRLPRKRLSTCSLLMSRRTKRLIEETRACSATSFKAFHFQSVRSVESRKRFDTKHVDEWVFLNGLHDVKSLFFH